MSRLCVAASSDRVESNNIPAGLAYPFTMGVWFNPVSVSAAQTVFNLANSGTTTDYIGLSVAAGGAPVLDCRSSTTNGGGSGAGTLSTGTWQHLTGVFRSAADRSIYLNGANRTDKTTSVTPSGLNRTSIGRLGRATPLQYADGYIGFASIWNIALSDSEVALIGTGTPQDRVQASAQVAYAKLNTNTSPEPDSVQVYTYTGTTPAFSSSDPTFVYPIAPRRQGPRRTAGLYAR